VIWGAYLHRVKPVGPKEILTKAQVVYESLARVEESMARTNSRIQTLVQLVDRRSAKGAPLQRVEG
jgi:hypothetical protein